MTARPSGSAVLSLTALLHSAVAFSVIASGTASAEDFEKQWAVLIGVPAYDDPAIPDLPLVDNDLSRLMSTLVKYGGMQPNRILLLSDEPAGPNAASTKQAVSAWLEKPGPRDSLVVYFSGHGFRDQSDEALYLATADFDPQRPRETGIAIEWLRRKLAECAAGSKLLLIDSCHAGTEGTSDGGRTPSAKALGATFEQVKDVVTIASCQDDENSHFYAQQERSLFSFWLTEGLKGHADRDRNGSIDIDELYKYVFGRVRHSAEVLHHKAQTPVRIVKTGVIDVPNVIRLRPQPLAATLANLAEHIAIVMEENKFEQIGVLEFLDNTETLQESLGGKFGLLGKYCAEELERQLADLSVDRGFRIVDRKRLRAALREQGFGVSDLESTKRLSELSKSVGTMPLIAIGSFQSRNGQIVHLQCNLQQTSGYEQYGTIGGLAALSVDEWAMLGRSGSVEIDDHNVDPAADPTTSISAQVVSRLDGRSEHSHTLQNPKFPFDVEIVVDGAVRQGRFVDGDYIVPLSKGEVYAIRIRPRKGRSGDIAVMKLLVDGLDTLPHSSQDTPPVETDRSPKGVTIESWAEPVMHLSDARSWVLDPQTLSASRPDEGWVVRGFVTKTGRDGKLRQFEVVDAIQSSAHRSSFTEQIGLITVAFYSAKSSSRSVGTLAGREQDENLEERSGFTAGDLIGVVHIRYVDADALPSAN